MIIEIMSRSSAKRFSYKKHDEKIAVISIVDMGNRRCYLMNNHPHSGIISQCDLMFDDVEEGELFVITNKDAEKIVEYVNMNISADRLIVHCEAGISRSSGTAAAIMKATKGDDWCIWKNKQYSPNLTCYKKIMTAFGIEINKEEFAEKIAISKSTKNGDIKTT